MTRRWRIVSLAAVLVLGAVVGVLFVVRTQTSSAFEEAARGNVVGFGPLPSADGAGYAVDFAKVDPANPLGDLRVMTIGDVAAPPGLFQNTLTQGVSQTQDAASYFERNFNRPVGQIGVSATFPPTGNAASAVALILADGPLPDLKVSQQRPNFGIHLVITAQKWELGVWSSAGALDVIAAGLFDARTLPGPARYEVQRDGSTARIVEPDGKITEVRDDRIGQYSGSWAVWELYQGAGGATSPRIDSWWAL